MKFDQLTKVTVVKIVAEPKVKEKAAPKFKVNISESIEEGKIIIAVYDNVLRKDVCRGVYKVEAKQRVLEMFKRMYSNLDIDNPTYVTTGRGEDLQVKLLDKKEINLEKKIKEGSVVIANITDLMEYISNKIEDDSFVGVVIGDMLFDDFLSYTKTQIYPYTEQDELEYKKCMISRAFSVTIGTKIITFKTYEGSRKVATTFKRPE